MSSCPVQHSCVFFKSIEPSLVKRVKHASAFPYCRGGQHESCSLYGDVVARRAVRANLLPSGLIGDYLEGATDSARTGAFLVVDDSPIFASIAANSIRNFVQGADVVQCASYEEAERHLMTGSVKLVVCGYGLGSGKTAHDVRRLCSAPIVMLTGRPESEIELPPNSRVVVKGAGPDALRTAILAALG